MTLKVAHVIMWFDSACKIS